jgi:hypothetical protein
MKVVFRLQLRSLRQRKDRPHARAQNEPAMSKKFPIQPAHPERTCWGCDRYCAADAMICGNGTERTQHPVELFGPGWEGFGLDPLRPAPLPAAEGDQPGLPSSRGRVSTPQ